MLFLISSKPVSFLHTGGCILDYRCATCSILVVSFLVFSRSCAVKRSETNFVSRGPPFIESGSLMEKSYLISESRTLSVQGQRFSSECMSKTKVAEGGRSTRHSDNGTPWAEISDLPPQGRAERRVCTTSDSLISASLVVVDRKGQRHVLVSGLETQELSQQPGELLEPLGLCPPRPTRAEALKNLLVALW